MRVNMFALPPRLRVAAAPKQPPKTAVRGRADRLRLPQKSLPIERVFSDATVKPFDQIEWDKRTAEITDDAGKVIFKQENVEVPKSWSFLATKVVVSKYFYGEQTHQRTGNVRPPVDSSRLPDDCRLGRCGRLFRQGRRRGFLRGTGLALRQSIRRL